MPSSTPTLSNFGPFLAIHGLVTLLATTLMLSVFELNSALNFAIGELFIWLSLLSVSLSVYLFFLKKNIALIVGAIVFKWPILIYVVYRLTEMVNSAPVFLALGFVPVVLSSIFWAAIQKE